jgi:cell division septum initiation protein DivIVA
MLAEAKREADRIVEEARDKAERQASQQEVVKMAEKQASDLLDDARMREREVRLGAEDYADEVLGGGPELMGILRASPYVGALAMAAWAGHRGGAGPMAARLEREAQRRQQAEPAEPAELVELVTLAEQREAPQREAQLQRQHFLHTPSLQRHSTTQVVQTLFTTSTFHH